MPTAIKSVVSFRFSFFVPFKSPFVRKKNNFDIFIIYTILYCKLYTRTKHNIYETAFILNLNT